MGRLPCDDVATCLDRRRKEMSYHAGDPRNWGSQCCNCALGRERRMASFTPDPDELKQPYRRSPSPCTSCGTIVQVPGMKKTVLCKPCYFTIRSAKAAAKRTTYVCKACGGRRTRYAVLCDPCYRASRRLTGKCRASNCTNKARRKGFCKRHATERLRKAQTNYRDKQHRIIRYQEAT